MLAAPSSGVRENELSSLSKDLPSPSHRFARPAYAAVLVFFALIALQYCLFRQYSLREVAWAHPTAADQSVYLLLSYQGFEKLLSSGLARGIWEVLTAPSPNGVMLPAQASLFYLFLGASRLSALTLLFLYFVAAEGALVWSMRQLSRSWPFTIATVSIFLLSASRFYHVGSLFDFRIDSVAASLYLITICIAIRSGVFLSRSLSIVCGAAAGMLVLFRFVAITYSGALFFGSAMTFWLFYIRTKNNPASKYEWKTRALNSMMAGVVLLAITGPLLVRNTPVFLAYYGSHLGSEKSFRQAELGLNSVAGHLLFYPISLCTDHLGLAYLIGILVLLAMLVTCTVRHGFSQISATPDRDKREIILAAAFCAAATLIPFILFTVDVVKSPVVACMLVGPITLVAALASLLVLRSGVWDSTSLNVGSAILAAFAVCHEFSAVSHHSVLIRSRAEENELLGTYRAALDYAREAGWKDLYVGRDRINDYTFPPNFSVMQYEWSGELYPAASALGNTNYTIPRERALADLENSNVAMLTLRSPRDANTAIPFDKAMASFQEDLNSAAKRMILLRTVTYNDHEMALFVRPSVRILNVSGGWLTANGAAVTAPCNQLAGKRTLVMSGSTIFSDMIGGALNVTAVWNAHGSSRPLAAKTSPVTNRYSIDIDLRNATVPDQGSCDIVLSFDRYFVPKDRGINADTRKLVVQAPTDFKFE